MCIILRLTHYKTKKSKPDSVIGVCVYSLQRQIRTAVFGGKSSVRGAASGTASSVAFTPLQVNNFTHNICP